MEMVMEMCLMMLMVGMGRVVVLGLEVVMVVVLGIAMRKSTYSDGSRECL